MKLIVRIVLVIALAPWQGRAEPVLAFSAAVEGETHIITYDFADGTMENFSETHLQPLHGVESYRSFSKAAWSPDGVRVAYVTNESGIHVADFGTGATIRRRSHTAASEAAKSPRLTVQSTTDYLAASASMARTHAVVR